MKILGSCLVLIVWMNSFALAQSQQTKPPSPSCVAQIKFTNGQLVRVRNDAPAVNVSADTILVYVFAAIGSPASDCMPANIWWTATYFDEDTNPICSGVIQMAAPSDSIWTRGFEIRPFTDTEFLRRMSTPPARPEAPLHCLGLDGISEIPPLELARALVIRIDATIVPKTGGVTTAGASWFLPRRN